MIWPIFELVFDPILEPAPMTSIATRRGFSLQQANATLPLVRVIVNDLLELQSDIQSREEWVTRFLKERTEKSGDPYNDELREVQRSLEEDHQLVIRYEDELEHLGVHFRASQNGVVEFPSWLRDRPVSLLWRPSDSCVSHWSQREGDVWQPIDDEPFTAWPQDQADVHSFPRDT
jgi:hypothetical protein